MSCIIVFQGLLIVKVLFNVLYASRHFLKLVDVKHQKQLGKEVATSELQVPVPQSPSQRAIILYF